MPPHRPAGSVPAFLRLLVIVGASVLLLFLEHDDRWAGFLKGAEAFSVSPVVRSTPSSPTTAATTTMDRTTAFSTASSTTATILFATLQPKKKYEPKWKKKATLTEQMGAPPAFQDVGIKGDVTVVFKQGNVTKTTLAIKGQPLRDVAIQAGQFIKYGCGKGECGTCEALCDGKWIRPCTAIVPPDAQNLVVMVKEIKSKKTTSSGKFFSVRSFLMGFWTNVVGMVGFAKSRRLAKQSWDERQEYEQLIKQRALEKKLARSSQQQGQQQPPNNHNNNNNLKP